MKAHKNAQKLMVWLRKHQPATVAQIAASGLMNSREATDAVQYGTRHTAFERVKRPGASPNERVLFQLTGQPLPILRAAGNAPSFDELLSAWGIPPVAPQFHGYTSRKCVQLFDDSLDQ